MYRPIKSIILNWLMRENTKDSASFLLDDIYIVTKLETDEYGQNPYLTATALRYGIEVAKHRFRIEDQQAMLDFCAEVNDKNMIFYQKNADEEMINYLNTLPAVGPFDPKKDEKINTIIKLSGNKTVSVERKYKDKDGAEHPWRVEGTLFTDGYAAKEFLEQTIYEKLTGKRVILHKALNIPSICGKEGAACRNTDQNSALCSNCPVAEKAKADKDGVELVYLQS